VQKIISILMQSYVPLQDLFSSGKYCYINIYYVLRAECFWTSQSTTLAGDVLCNIMLPSLMWSILGPIFNTIQEIYPMSRGTVPVIIAQVEKHKMRSDVAAGDVGHKLMPLPFHPDTTCSLPELANNQLSERSTFLSFAVYGNMPTNSRLSINRMPYVKVLSGSSRAH
jgi:hypothetical protein